MVLPLLIIGIMGWAAWKDAEDKLDEIDKEKPKEKPKENAKTIDKKTMDDARAAAYAKMYQDRIKARLDYKLNGLNYDFWKNSPQRKDYLKTMEQFMRPRGIGRNLDSDDFGGPKRVVYDNPIEISKYQNWRKINKI